MPVSSRIKIRPIRLIWGISVEGDFSEEHTGNPPPGAGAGAILLEGGALWSQAVQPGW